MRFGVVFYLAWLVFCAVCGAEELLQNPGFESRDFSGWDVRGQGWTIDGKSFSEGAVSALCTIKKGDKPGLRACVQKITDADAGKLVEVSMDVSGVSVVQPANSKACLAILCFDAQGIVLKEYRSNVVRPTAEFQPVKIDDAIVLQGTTEVYVMLVVEVYQPATDSDLWRFDNIILKIH